MGFFNAKLILFKNLQFNIHILVLSLSSTKLTVMLFSSGSLWSAYQITGYIYCHNSTSRRIYFVLQYFGNIFALFFRLEQKRTSIQSSDHCMAPSEANFLPVLWYHTDTNSYSPRQRTRSLNLPPLVCLLKRREQKWAIDWNNL